MIGTVLPFRQIHNIPNKEMADENLGPTFAAKIYVTDKNLNIHAPEINLLRDEVKESGERAMSDITREELDAKLAAAEARTQTRFVELSAKSDRVADSIDRIGADFVRVAKEIKEDNKSTRNTIVIAIVGGIIAGLAALWVTQSNMLSSFQLGIALHEAKSNPESLTPGK
jgi:hypothetical protein